MLANSAHAGPFTYTNKWGDMFLAGSVFYAYGMAARDGDLEGVWQLTGSVAASQLATEGLKHMVHEQRPDGSDYLSFPSGHAAGAFSGAMFVHKRYGWKPAIAPYVMSGISAWQRVDSRRHYWWDAAGAAAISALFTWMIVDEFQVSAAPGLVAVKYQTGF